MTNSISKSGETQEFYPYAVPADRLRERLRLLSKAGWCLLLAVVLSFAACSKQAEEDRVRKAIESVRRSAESRDAGSVLSHISRDYRDPEGNDYQAVRNLLLIYFVRHPKITVIISNMDVTVQGMSASAGFQAVLSGGAGASGGFFPEDLGAYRFDVSLVKIYGEWKIISARWARWGENGPGPGAPP